MQKIRITMENGDCMDFGLYEEVAPITVKNFLDLVDAKFFDGLCFHRVIPGFMIQGGGFEWKDGLKDKSSPLGKIKGEFASNGVKNDIKHEAGVISMARTSIKDSATSQFFICVDDATFLDKEYAGFGKVLDEKSLEVAIKISKVQTFTYYYYENVPVSPVIIKTIRRI